MVIIAVLVVGPVELVMVTVVVGSLMMSLKGFKECFYTENGDGSSGIGPTSDEDISPFTLDQIRIWVRQALEFPPQAPIVVKEVPCVKPGCPPIETAIMVLLENEPPRFYKIQKTINAVTFDSVYDLIDNPMPCC